MATRKDIYSVSDEDFIQIVKNCDTLKKCLLALGITTYTNGVRNILKERIAELEIDISHFEIFHFHKSLTKHKHSLEEILVENSPYEIDGSRLIKRLLEENLKEYKCECCGISGFYNNKPITLQLHHKNGNHSDNRLENLQILCPNCHSQTDTYAGKTIIRKRAKRKELRKAKIHTCPDCGNQIHHQSTRCKACSDKLKAIKRVESSKAPSKEILEELLETKSVAEIARDYNVSWNAVKKWIQKYEVKYVSRQHNEIPSEVIEMYQNGKSIINIASELHIDPTRISAFIKQKTELKSTNKPVFQKDKDGSLVKRWESTAAAAANLALKDKSKIGACANRKRQTAYGYVWEWAS